MGKEDLINLPQRLAEKYGTGEALTMRGFLRSSHQALELTVEGQRIGYISWGRGMH